MAVLPFKVSASGSFSAQPLSSGEKILIRSTSAADTMNATLSGVVSATPTAETVALLGAREVQTTNTFTSLTMAKMASAPAGTVNFYRQGTKGSGVITVGALPANNTTLTIGLTGFTQVYTFKTVLTGAANEILIAADIFQQASNIFEAINNGTVAEANNGTQAGTRYGTGTVRNTFIDAYSTAAFATADLDRTTQTSVYIRDRLAIVRQLTWVLSSTAAAGVFTQLVSILGATTGTLIVALTSSATQIASAMTFYNPTLSAVLGTGLLLAATTPTSDPLYIGGKATTIRLYAANYASAVTVDLEVSDDGVTWITMGLTISTLDNNNQWFNPSPLEWIRLVVSANSNTVDSALHCVVISP